MISVKSVTLEVAAKCNLKCEMCPTGQGRIERKTALMPLELIDKILRENPGLERINLNNWGEPLLHLQFEDILVRINRALPDCKIYFATNATLLKKSMIDLLLKYSIYEIQISIDGTDEVYTQLRGCDYALVRRNVLNFLERKKKVGNEVRTVIKAVVNGRTESKIDRLDEWNGRVDEVRVQPEIMFDSPSTRKTECPELFNNHLVILTDGRATPCCADYNGGLYIGQAYEQTLEEMWNGPEIQKYRMLHEGSRYPEVCMKCSEYRTDKCKERFL